ncbi:MAG: hypothetical protein KAS07_04100 [Candidatus Pacebacteria bacterium]|nr:hypothetical protein [Candidatus Paceibacterota bacterium]
MITKIIWNIFILLAICLFITPSAVFAVSDSFSLSPLIVDEKAKPRDILKQTAVLTNNTERKVTIYVTVKNMDLSDGEQVFEHYNKAEIETSLANWIEIKRSVIELEPGETKRIPYLIQVHLSALPGIYHAKAYFQEGSNRGEAQSRIKTWHAIDLNIEVLDDVKERLQLSSFAPDKVFFTGSTASFSYLLENIGNRSVAPRGEIRIFNRRGEEVAALPANGDGTSLLPEATSLLGSAWEATGKFGRYKAYLDIEYGDKQLGTVNDTIFFWIVPWKQILLLFVGFAVAVVIAGYVAYDKYGFNKKPATASIYEEVEELVVRQNAVQPQVRVAAQPKQPIMQVQSVRQTNPTQEAAMVMRQSKTQQPAGQTTKLQSRQKQVQTLPHGAVVSLKKRG